MAKTNEGRAPFDLCGGHPALDFVNSLNNRFREGGPTELLTDYADLLRFAQQTGLLDSRQVRRLVGRADPGAAVRTLRSAREMREAMAAALYASVDGRAPLATDVRTLERYFHGAGAHRELRWTQPGNEGQPGLEWDWGRFETNAELPLWILSQSASQLMMSDAMPRIRACGVETCRWLFLDTSKNHTRRWCNMKVCGNRMKARRFQARHEG